MKSLTLTLAFFFSLGATAADLSPGQYNIDPAHSKVGFEVAHLVVSTVEGSFATFSGKVDLAKRFTKSKVTAEVDVSSIDTGVEKRDGHLRSADFFDVANHKKMLFVSKKISGSQKSFKMTGDLTIKGVKKEVTFEGRVLGRIPNDGFGNEKLAFEATTQINRKDFGLTWNNVVEVGPVVGDLIKIELKIQAARPIKK